MISLVSPAAAAASRNLGGMPLPFSPDVHRHVPAFQVHDYSPVEGHHGHHHNKQNNNTNNNHDGSSSASHRRKVSIQVAAASYLHKSEDRHVVWHTARTNARLYQSPRTNSAHASSDQNNNNSNNNNTDRSSNGDGSSSSAPTDAHPLSLLTFVGVFDGHEGPRAAEYCAQRLLSHVQAETDELGLTRTRPVGATTTTTTTTKASTHASVNNHNSSNSTNNGNSGGPAGFWDRPLRRRRRNYSCRDAPKQVADSQIVPLEEEDSFTKSAATTASSSSSQQQAQQQEPKSALQNCYIRAFHRTHELFQEERQPDPRQHQAAFPPAPMTNPFRFCRSALAAWVPDTRLSRGSLSGGTTACTLSIYATEDGVSAVVANCGDSRLIYKNLVQQRGAPFVQVTQDHRPANPDEYRRFLLSRHSYVARDSRSGTLRVYPGGLAVSRTIGDCHHSGDIIPTPEVFEIPLSRPSRGTDGADDEKKDDSGGGGGGGEPHGGLFQTLFPSPQKAVLRENQTFRFILATDGLWDAMSVEQVSRAADCTTNNSISFTAVDDLTTPLETASSIMEDCLLRRPPLDDITLVVLDVTVPC